MEGGREECEQCKKNYDVNIEPVGYLQNHDCEEEFQEEYEDYEEYDEDYPWRKR